MWLRVGSEQTRRLDDPWSGNIYANVITGVPKPRVLDWREWEVPEQHRRVRAEVMTLLPGEPCSTTDVLRQPATLPDAWWAELCRTINTIRTTPTARFLHNTEPTRVRQVFGDRVADAVTLRWETVHGDLHWNNLFGPQFGLLDWEMWGRGLVGTDAATLYLHSLLCPDTAAQVWAMFSDVLDTDAGRTALIAVSARILHRAQLGDYPDLAGEVRDFVAPMLA